MFWKGEGRERERLAQSLIDQFPSPGLFTWQEPGLGQTKARSLELHSGFPCEPLPAASQDMHLEEAGQEAEQLEIESGTWLGNVSDTMGVCQTATLIDPSLP